MQIMSDSIKEISKALSVAQSKIGNVKKDKEGYGYKYAELEQCLELIKLPLAESELALTQLPHVSEQGLPILITMLVHSSGEWIRSVFPLKAQGSKQTNEMQALGSGITYLRRYAVCSMMGIAQEDDDGVASAPQRNDNIRTIPISSERDWAIQLKSLCDKAGIDVKDFANTLGIQSSNVEMVKNAVNNFAPMLDVYRDTASNTIK